MKHLDLFSGIGGFAYAIDQVWDNVEHVFVESDPFCRAVLRKHWQNAMIFSDVRTFPEEWRNYVQNAERRNAIQSGGLGVGSVNRTTTENGIRKTENGGKRIVGDIYGRYEIPLSKVTEESVSVVGKRIESSSPLTTKMEEEIKTVESGAQVITEKSSKKTSQNTFKSSATTVTKPKDITEYVHTKKGFEIHGDIRTFTAHAERERPHLAQDQQELEGEGGRELRSIERRPFLLTGGFPCQPFSQAGRRKGTADDRFLWHEMARVIREWKPQWVVAENVGGLVTWNEGMVLEQVCSDLENESYEVQTFVIPACAVNAPHRRDRVWIVAHRNGGESDAGHESEPRGTTHIESGADGRNSNASDTKSSKRERERRAARNWRSEFGCPDWRENWLEVATRLCTLDDGLPNGLPRPRGWRNAALKAVGNSIVPQVAEEIFRAIKAVDPNPLEGKE